jgi:AcrR family transcriptional regulator
VPKLAKERTQENRRRIEAAALALFTKQGFHGTNNRQIADKVGVSTGTLYTYFPGKEAIFSSLAHRYRTHMHERFRRAVGELKNPLSKQGLKKLAAEVAAAMYEDPEYFLLLLSDVIEFRNQHFRQVFHNVPRQLRRLVGPVLDRVKQQPGWRGEEPAFVLASVYLYFFTYFLMERHMQGDHHLGVSDDQATERFIDLLFGGLWGSRPGSRRSSDVTRRRHMLPAQQERIAYLRFLSGRLLNVPRGFPPGLTQNGSGGSPARRPILFFPEIPRDRIDENQLKVEAAALALFTTQGFHGTNMRDIAEKAGVSQGAIYTYYPSKEAIFEGLVRSYRHSMRGFLERVFSVMQDPFSESDLRLFAAAMRSMVYDDGEYWLLMYIDVIEFKNRHFLKIFRDIPEQFRHLLGPAAARTRKQAGWCKQDPAFVMAMIYFYFHTYFVIERLMHGNRHLGVSDEEVCERFIDILCHGLWSTPASSPRKQRR